MLEGTLNLLKRSTAGSKVIPPTEQKTAGNKMFSTHAQKGCAHGCFGWSGASAVLSFWTCDLLLLNHCFHKVLV